MADSTPPAPACTRSAAHAGTADANNHLARELGDRLEQPIDLVAVVVGDDAGTQGAVWLEAQPARELEGAVVAVPHGALGARGVGGDVLRRVPGSNKHDRRGVLASGAMESHTSEGAQA